jgi:hypothetical protein
MHSVGVILLRYPLSNPEIELVERGILWSSSFGPTSALRAIWKEKELLFLLVILGLNQPQIGSNSRYRHQNLNYGKELHSQWHLPLNYNPLREGIFTCCARRGTGPINSPLSLVQRHWYFSLFNEMRLFDQRNCKIMHYDFLFKNCKRVKGLWASQL